MSSPRVILVTGASSGFGRALVDLILEQGDIAVAALRKPEAISDLSSKYGTDRLLVLKLDITVEEERKTAFDKIKETYGRLDVAIQNAGIVGDVGEKEGIPDEGARKTFETNYWGTFDMVEKSVKFMRDVNKPGEGGRILVISSFVGYANFPGCATYNASKAALESGIASYAGELDPKWGVKITLIQPGMYSTSATANATIHPVHPAYTDASLAVNQLRGMAASSEGRGDPLQGAKAILKLATVTPKEELPLRQPIGSDSAALILQGLKMVEDAVEKGKAFAAEGDRA